jgi:hypothetical protein
VTRSKSSRNNPPAPVNSPIETGAAPLGAWTFFGATGGWEQGERLAGDLIGGGGDWPLIGPDGLARVDVRLQLRTDDGAAIYIAYVGVLELN